ncbi:mCG1037813, partial [Mus musculus]
TLNWGTLFEWSSIKGSCDPSVCLPIFLELSGHSYVILFMPIRAQKKKKKKKSLRSDWSELMALLFRENTKAWWQSVAHCLWGHRAWCVEPGDSQTVVKTSSYYNSVAIIGNHLAHQTYILHIHRAEEDWAKFTSNHVIHGF